MATTAQPSILLKYKGLIEPDSFRLLLLHPAALHDSPLHCDLLHTTLSRCDREIIDQYIALSYVWGDPASKGSIYVNGTLVTITATLDAALRDLRDESRVLRVWADALCIDQSSMDERASQVNLMAQIYSVANHTVIHLGALTMKNSIVLKASPSNTSGVVHQNLDSTALVEFAEGSILKAVWFTRVWVFQELVLSRDPWIQCGNLRARWADICNLLTAGTFNQKSKALQMMADMETSRGSSRSLLLVLLTARRGLGATDPRDFVYANMGLASDLQQLEAYIKADYRESTSTAQVYENVAKYLLENSGPGGPETYFPLVASDGYQRLKDLASWAPDWRLPAAGLEKMYRDNNLRRLVLQSEAHYVLVGTSMTLAWVGYEVDVVESFSEVFLDPTALDPAARYEYQAAVRLLSVMYSNVWWSGDEFGQHQHVDLRGKEAKHDELCRVIGSEWLKIVGQDLPAICGSAWGDHDENRNHFLAGFGAWLDGRASQEIIMAGHGSEDMASVMYCHLISSPIPSILTGRRIAVTRSGNVGVVPANVRKGDVVVYLAGPTISLVLRPRPMPQDESLETTMKRALRSKNGVNLHEGMKRAPQMEGVLDMEIQSCTLVGECYLDGEISWEEQHAHEVECVIYAIR